jgi:hypothetical protein
MAHPPPAPVPADPRATALAALNPAHRAAAVTAVGAALVDNALLGMTTTAELTASGNAVLQFLAAHGAALAPILPLYQRPFAFRAARHGVVAAELTVLGWFRGERGTMPGTVRLNDRRITSHGGNNFSVNFPHFAKVHLARYADAATLRARTAPTTFYPGTMTTATFVTNQLQAGLNAWPDMTALVAAINSGRTDYNRMEQLTHGTYTFQLRVVVRRGARGGHPGLHQCFPIAPDGGAIMLTATRTRIMGELLGLRR